MRGLLRCSSTLALSLALSPALLAGCGDDDVPSVPTDAGPRDAQVRDASPGDGGDLDGGDRDGGDLDGGETRDGGGFDPARCTFDPAEDLITLATDTRLRVRDVGLAAGPTAHAVAWSATMAGFEQVFYAELPASGTLVGGTMVTTGFTTQRDPVIASDAPGWTLAWSSNSAGTFDVYAQRWEADRADGVVQPLGTSAGLDDAPALLPITGGTLAAWVETRMDTQRVALTRPLGADAVPSDAQREVSGATTVARPVLALREGGYSFAYVDSTGAGAGATPTVRLLALDASRGVVGTPVTINTEGNADGTVDLATDADGGAAVFGVSVGGARAEVRARELDGTGQTSGPERVITPAPEAGRDPSIARLAGGYVIAYRGVEGVTPELRLAFVDASLEVVGNLDITTVEPIGGRTTVRVSGEGRIVIAWADVGASATTIRAARVRCE